MPMVALTLFEILLAIGAACAGHLFIAGCLLAIAMMMAFLTYVVLG